MTPHSPAHYFFISLIIAVSILTLLIFLPYASSLILALVLSILFRPLYNWISKIVAHGKEGSSTATFITLIIVAVVIITPLLFLAFQLYTEGQTVYFNLTEEGERASIVNGLNNASAWFSSHFFGIGSGVTFDSFNVTQYIQNIFQWIFSNFNTLFSSAARIILHLIIMLFAFFYFLRDGGAMKRQIIILSPLLDNYDEKIMAKLEMAINSVMRGTLVVGLIQGICTGLGFWAFGIPDPVLWGSLAVIAALIPGIGTSLILIPGIIYLFFMGMNLQAFGLLIWWVIAVSIIDNYIGPRLMNRGVQIHQFLILLSVLGGIAFFGPIGFITGPLVIALLFALLDVYKTYRTSIQ